MRVPFAAALVVFALQSAPTRANDFPADVWIKGDYARVSMYLGDRLRENAPLAIHCKMETREWALAVEASERAKLVAPPAELPSFGRRYDITEIVGKRYVSIIRMSGTDIDDEYHAIDYSTFIWDSVARERVSLAKFFKEMVDGGPTMSRLLTEAKERLAKKAGYGRSAALIETLRPSLDGIGPISLTPSTASGKSSGLSIHYLVPRPGQFASESVEIFIPWTAFARYLSPLGRSSFAGSWSERHIW
jgi:hypothetical protein